MTPSFISWFSGVGMFDLALIRAGFERRGACEIDKFARKVYAARLGAPAFFSEDITSVEAKDIPDADVWIGGFPCQDVSVAGKRAGIGDGDTRSGLVHTFLRLAVAKRPRFLLLENVPGLLSGATNDGRSAGDVERDEMGEPAGDALWFGALLGALAESGYRHGAWRILDARWFGVAQRRRRVFLLFARDPRDGAVARAVLSEPESVRRGPPTRGEAGAGVAAGTRGGAPGERVVNALDCARGGPDDNDAQAGRLIVAHETGQGWWTEGAGTLRAGASGSNPTGHIVAATLTSGGHPNSNAPGRRAEDDVNLVAHTLQAADGHHGRRSPRGDGGDNLVVAATINASYDRGAVGHNRDENLVPVAFDHAQITHPANGSRCAPGDPVPTPHAGGDAFVAFASNTRSEVRDLGDQAACLSSARGTNQTTYIAAVPLDLRQLARGEKNTNDRTDGGAPGTGVGAEGDPAFTVSERGQAVFAGHGAVFPTLRGFGHGWQGQQNDDASKAGMVRRLTPLECERLQGLPDFWTCLCGATSTAACKCADGPRYRAIGNGGAVPVVGWIGRRMRERMSETLEASK